MFSFFVFAISMICLVKSGWLVTESLAAYLSGGLEGIFRIFDRRFNSLSDLLLEVVAFLVSSAWIVCKASGPTEDSVSPGCVVGRVGQHQSTNHWSSIRNDWVDDQIGLSGATTDDRVALYDSENEILATNEASHFSEFDEPSINPANGLPMMGSIDIEGNPYGTDFDDTGSSIDDDFSTSCFDDFSSCDSCDLMSEDISSGIDDGISDWP